MILLKILKINIKMCSDNLENISKLSKETPFINFLINKRINFCKLGSSNHIATFIPVSFDKYFFTYAKWTRNHR